VTEYIVPKPIGRADAGPPVVEISHERQALVAVGEQQPAFQREAGHLCLQRIGGVEIEAGVLTVEALGHGRFVFPPQPQVQS
jgi:hypothetical protein